MLTGLYARLISFGLIIAVVLSAVLYVRSLRADIKTLSEEKTVLTQRVEMHNAAVAELKRNADARLATADVALRHAKAETTKAVKRAKDFYHAKPSILSDDCKNTLDLANSAKSTLDLINNPDAAALPEEIK